MTVEERVAQYLRQQRRAYCDDCLGRLLRLGTEGNRHMARNATAALGASGAFTREKGECSQCAAGKMVTRSN